MIPALHERERESKHTFVKSPPRRIPKLGLQRRPRLTKINFVGKQTSSGGFLYGARYIFIRRNTQMFTLTYAKGSVHPLVNGGFRSGWANKVVLVAYFQK